MNVVRLSGIAVCTVFVCLILSSVSLAGKPDDRAAESRLYEALLKVDSSAKLWVGEGYGEIYTRFTQALSAASLPYKKLLKSGSSGRRKMLLTIYEDYAEAHDFLRDYLNDKAVIMRANRFFEPTYLLKRDAWPARLEKRFPGVIEALKEHDNNGEFIIGRTALDFIFARIHDKLVSLYPADALFHRKGLVGGRHEPERTEECAKSSSPFVPSLAGEGFRLPAGKAEGVSEGI